MKKQFIRSAIIIIAAVIITSLLRLRPAKLKIVDQDNTSLHYTLSLPYFTFHQNLILQTYTGKDGEWTLNNEDINLYDIQGSRVLDIIVDKSNKDLAVTVTNNKGTTIAEKTYALKDYTLENVNFASYKVEERISRRQEHDLFTILRLTEDTPDITSDTRADLHYVTNFSEGFYLSLILD